MIINDDGGNYASALSLGRRDVESDLDESVKYFKGNRRRGMFGWFKAKVSSDKGLLLNYLFCCCYLVHQGRGIEIFCQISSHESLGKIVICSCDSC